MDLPYSELLYGAQKMVVCRIVLRLLLEPTIALSNLPRKQMGTLFGMKGLHTVEFC